MIRVIRAHERHFTDFEWLQTYWLFSFSEYYDARFAHFEIAFQELEVQF